jgi:hypothetical protein
MRRLSCSGIPCAHPTLPASAILCFFSVGATARPLVVVLQIAFSKNAARAMVKRSVLCQHLHTSATTASQTHRSEAISPTATPYQCAISIYLPAPPTARLLSVLSTSHAASIVPPLRGRRRDALSYCPPSPCNVAMRH